MRSLILQLKSYRRFEIIIVSLTLLFPVISTIALWLYNSDSTYIYNLLWIGLYSSLLTAKFIKPNYVKFSLILLNLFCWIIWVIGISTTSIGTFLIMVVKTVIPFIPLSVLYNLIS